MTKTKTDRPADKLRAVIVRHELKRLGTLAIERVLDLVQARATNAVGPLDSLLRDHSHVLVTLATLDGVEVIVFDAGGGEGADEAARAYVDGFLARHKIAKRRETSTAKRKAKQEAAKQETPS